MNFANFIVMETGHDFTISEDFVTVSIGWLKSLPWWGKPFLKTP